MADAVVVVRGAHLALDRWGSGPPFVWCHGLTESRAREDERRLHDWSPVVTAGVELIRYDARSHGRSSTSSTAADHRWDALAADLLALLDALDLERVVAGGSSLGCATALLAALTEPARFEGLVLACPPTAWSTRSDQSGLYESGARVVETSGVGALVDAVSELPPPPLFAEEPELAQFAPDVSEAALPAVLRGAAASDLPEPEALATLRQPALVLAWDGDPGHPLSTAEVLADTMPGAELVVASDLADVRTWPASVAAWMRRNRFVSS